MQHVLSKGPHFVHRIDPIFLEVWDVKLYYYGLAYALGFLGIHLWLRLRRGKLGWHREEVYDLSILVAVCVLVFGRAFEILVYEWEYYRDHLSQLLSYWRGGMASHGVLLGAVVGIWLFSRLRRKSFIQIADELAIPAAFFLGLGRIGNFINGQIFGYVTNVWWAVKFPDAEGFRHPVALYESLKNFLLVPILFFVRRTTRPGQGKLLAHFVFWYGFLRLFTDYFREYGTEFLGIGTGQYFSLFMALLGLGLLAWRSRPSPLRDAADSGEQFIRVSPTADSYHETNQNVDVFRLNIKRVVFTMLLVFSLTIPSGWTQGVLKQYREQQLIQQMSEQKAELLR